MHSCRARDGKTLMRGDAKGIKKNDAQTLFSSENTSLRFDGVGSGEVGDTAAWVAAPLSAPRQQTPVKDREEALADADRRLRSARATSRDRVAVVTSWVLRQVLEREMKYNGCVEKVADDEGARRKA